MKAWQANKISNENTFFHQLYGVIELAAKNGLKKIQQRNFGGGAIDHFITDEALPGIIETLQNDGYQVEVIRNMHKLYIGMEISWSDAIEPKQETES